RTGPRARVDQAGLRGGPARLDSRPVAQRRGDAGRRRAMAAAGVALRPHHRQQPGPSGDPARRLRGGAGLVHAQTSPALAAHGLSKRFASLVVFEDVSLTLSAGEVLGVVGPNGAGKSTLLSVLTGTLHGDGGRVLLGSDD